MQLCIAVHMAAALFCVSLALCLLSLEALPLKSPNPEAVMLEYHVADASTYFARESLWNAGTSCSGVVTLFRTASLHPLRPFELDCLDWSGHSSKQTSQCACLCTLPIF